MQYPVKELAADRFMLVADTGEPVLATMNNRDWAQRMAEKLTMASVSEEAETRAPQVTLERSQPSH